MVVDEVLPDVASCVVLAEAVGNAAAAAVAAEAVVAVVGIDDDSSCSILPF